MSTSRVTYLGHATCLIETPGLTLLTDPVFGDRALFFKRRSPFPVPVGDLPTPSVILISHSHYDHLDMGALKYFPSSVPIVTARSLGKLISKFVRNPIVEIAHDATEEVLPGLRLTAFPVNHHGSRLSGFTYRSANGYWIEMKGKKIFFPGDTGYREDFKSFHAPDLALLPLGPCEPAWYMRKRHLNSEDLLRLSGELEAKLTVPVHWGVFKLGLDPLNTPIDALRKALIDNPPRRMISILNLGQGTEF